MLFILCQQSFFITEKVRMNNKTPKVGIILFYTICCIVAHLMMYLMALLYNDTGAVMGSVTKYNMLPDHKATFVIVIHLPKTVTYCRYNYIFCMQCNMHNDCSHGDYHNIIRWILHWQWLLNWATEIQAKDYIKGVNRTNMKNFLENCSYQELSVLSPLRNKRGMRLSTVYSPRDINEC